MGHYDALSGTIKESVDRMNEKGPEGRVCDILARRAMEHKGCDLPLPAFKGSQIVAAPRSQWTLWLSQFNLVNWLGLVMFILPVCVAYVAIHFWLLQHDPVLYYTSLYAQLGLLLMAWKQL